jgi:hypothetical protein
MAKVITNTQMSQIIELNGDRMTVRSFSSEGEQLDTVEINKRAGHSAPTAAGSAAASSGRR